MPFRLDPDNRRCVQVQREDGSWERVEGGCHETVADAEKQLAALRINVDEADEESVPESYQIHEHFGQGFAFREAQVDGRMIRNVSLLGKASKNGHTYTDTAMREASDLFVGTGVFLDHPRRDELRERRGNRSFRDLAGRVLSTRVAGNRVRGDIEVLEGTDGDKLLAVAQRMPKVAGFSLRGDGEKRVSESGEAFIEHVTAIGGADVVVDPATTDGLFEQIEDEAETQESNMTLDELTVEQIEKERPDLVEEIRESAETEAEIKRLREENDALKAEKAERERKALIEEKLSETGLPDRAVTDTFRELLEDADEVSEIDRLIEDRAALVASSGSGPKSSAKDPDELFESGGDFKPVTPEALEKADATLWN